MPSRVADLRGAGAPGALGFLGLLGFTVYGYIGDNGKENGNYQNRIKYKYCIQRVKLDHDLLRVEFRL